jgi:uncharacterized protein YjbJ (UPF0337 family)
MNVNSDQIKSQWNEVKTEIQKTWSKLSPDEIEKTHGDEDSLSELVHDKYGVERGAFESQYAEMMSRFEDVEEASRSDPKIPRTVL